MVDKKLPTVIELGKTGNPIRAGTYIEKPTNVSRKYFEWRKGEMPTEICPACGARTGLVGVQWICSECRTMHVFEGFGEAMTPLDLSDFPDEEE